MLDINFIRENKDLVKKAVLEKGVELDVELLLKIDQKRRDLIVEIDQLRQQRKKWAQEKNIEKGKEVKEKLDTLEEELREVEDHFLHLMLHVPNIPSADSPVGPDSGSNKELFKWGEIPKFEFPIRDHVELGKLLDILDLAAGVKASGFRGYYLKNEGAILHWALMQFAWEKIISSGFTPLVTPSLVHEKVLIGSGHFPFGKENIYQIVNPGKLETGEEIKNPLFLNGTSEPSLLAYYMDKVIPEIHLPIKVCAMTQCFRSEVGDYGKDTKGLFRVHEFTKVEQVVICKNDLDEAGKWFEKMQQISEQILQDLGLPYHVVSTSTGDMGAGKYKMNDLESWMPSRGKYSETHSNSSLTDWQARRLNMKFKTKDGKSYFCYTLNNTVIASPRILIPILENFQQEDGSVKIPEALQKYTGFSVINPK